MVRGNRRRESARLKVIACRVKDGVYVAHCDLVRRTGWYAFFNPLKFEKTWDEFCGKYSMDDGWKAANWRSSQIRVKKNGALTGREEFVDNFDDMLNRWLIESGARA